MTVITTQRLTAAAPKAIEEAAHCLAGGGLVAFPTETVYGLGADATNAKAVASLYAAKGRPAFNPLIAHVGTHQDAQRLARFDADATRLAQAFWPGPLTLVLPKVAACPVAELATAGLDSIAVRVPAHPVARALIAALGKPVVAPSANRSGHVSPTSAAHVLLDLDGRVDFILDGGPSAVGVESTIIACLDTPTLLRPGGLAREAIEDVLGHPLHVADAHSSDTEDDDAPLAPGMLLSHYAPRARLRLGAAAAGDGEALLAFGPHVPRTQGKHALTLNLSTTGDLIEAAANLYAHLRALDASGAAAIAVMPIPAQGLGEAINDRLRRAAAPRG
jgi:L-threonylcarbamoyladenylate synthase